jgi:hypothetical protein
VVGDLVEDNSFDLVAEPLGVVPVQTHERAAVDRDLVEQNAAVVAAALVSGTPLDVLAARFAAFWLWSESRWRPIAVPGGDASGSR